MRQCSIGAFDTPTQQRTLMKQKQLTEQAGRAIAVAATGFPHNAVAV